MRKPLGATSLQAPRPPPAPPASAADKAAAAGGAEGGGGAADAATKRLEAEAAASAGAEREERGKKSAAYKHTEFHRTAMDATGKQFERRMCRYCDAIFSFKGGTTSAALRHLKTAHPEQLLGTGTEISSVAAVAAAAVAVLRDERVQQLQQHKQHQLELEQRQQLQQQQQPPIQQQTEHAQASASQTESSEEEETLTESDGSPSGINALPDVAAPTVDSNNSTNHSVGSATTTTPGVEEDVNYYAQKERKLRSILKRKRESGSFDVDFGSRPETPPTAGLAGLAATPAQFALLPTQAGTVGTTFQQLTASQVAIQHALQHYKEELPVSMRLKLAKHLTKNVGEAEMYNVLDDATRAEYVREFVNSLSSEQDKTVSSTI